MANNIIIIYSMAIIISHLYVDGHTIRRFASSLQNESFARRRRSLCSIRLAPWSPASHAKTTSSDRDWAASVLDKSLISQKRYKN